MRAYASLPLPLSLRPALEGSPHAWGGLQRGPRTSAAVSKQPVRDTGQFPTPNPIDRYVISSETEGLVTNPDGGIDITIRAAAPDTSGTNWLPSPADGTPFILFARSYIPESSVLAGDYTMPPVTPA